jgi:uncharacterized RDD family membrane protein YckC
VERVLEVPAFRKREPSWRDEVRERMRHRRRPRPDSAELPLFPEPGAPEAEATEPGEPAASEREADLAADEPQLADVEMPRVDVVDLPMRPVDADRADEEPAPAAPRLVELGERELDTPPTWTLEADPADEPAASPLERPALVAERAQAAALDLLMVGTTAALVVYFAARAARVSVLGLLPAWPWIAGFVAFFGLVYAAFFTGLTGQTLGKMALRLRVVDRAGVPPGHARAALRALLGSVGSLALVGVVPAFMDPARRALHDRLLKTRVIRV